jgi:D-alanyl-D-alanine dipeptidase
MKSEEIYAQLEANALGYTDLVDVPVMPIDEPLVAIPQTANLTSRQIGKDMRPITGDRIYLRQTAAERLGAASLTLASYDNSLALEVVYGYRALSIQQKLYDGFAEELHDDYSSEALREAVHRLIAVPDVAGHPTGGAVDLQITQGSQPLDFGTSIWEFVPDSFTFSPFVSDKAQQNRQLLRRVMTASGFAPFDGEWWHFCYGDKEWARYYRQPSARYEQTEFRPSASC